MFQNISDDINQNETENNNKINNRYKIKNALKNAVRGQNILLYIISFMLSFVGAEGLNFSLFALAIFGATCSNDIPIGILYIVTLIGTLIKFETSGLLSYMFVTAIFIALILIFRPKKIAEQFQNEKRKLGKYLIIAIIIGQASKMFFQPFLLYDLFVSITYAVTCYIFYKIFSKSIIVINEIKNKKVFALEEIIGACVMVAIASTCFGDFKILGLHIGNVISILIVLVLGWKKGVLVGTTIGVTVGCVLGIITSSNPILIASYAFSGMIAGILNKFGKIGVIIGFVIGNLILNYTYSGNLTEIIYLKEIIVASLALILIPRNIEINIEEVFSNSTILQEGAKYRLEESKDTIEKLNSVSQVIQEMSDTYKEAAATLATEEDIKQNNKEIFIDILQEKMEEKTENIFYEDVFQDNNEKFLSIIFEHVDKKERINRADLIEILKENNSYIINSNNYNVSQKINKDMDEFVKAINDSYKTEKEKFLIKTKINENKKTISDQLNGVSKVISNIAQEIEPEKKEKFKKEIEKIKILCAQKDINIIEIKVKKEKTERIIIKIITKSKIENEISKEIENILTRVFNEPIKMQTNKQSIEGTIKTNYQYYVSEDNFKIQLGISKKEKEGQEVSGDSNIKLKLNDGKYLIAISDGMGSGKEANKASSLAIKMLGKLFINGFDKDTSIKLINDTLTIDSEKETYATLDIMVLDLFKGNIEFIKNGAAPTYIKNGKNVEIIKNISIPTGIIQNVDLVIFDRDIENENIIVMCSDGIIESNSEYKNKELWVKNILEKIETTNAQKIADLILKEAIDNNYGTTKDDMTVIVAKVKKK